MPICAHSMAGNDSLTLSLCHSSFLVSFVCRACSIKGGRTNAFQSVAGFTFPPVVDKDGGVGVGRVCVEREWESSREIPRVCYDGITVLSGFP